MKILKSFKDLDFAQFRKDIDIALYQVGKKYGIAITMDRGSYNENQFTFKSCALIVDNKTATENPRVIQYLN